MQQFLGDTAGQIVDGIEGGAFEDFAGQGFNAAGGFGDDFANATQFATDRFGPGGFGEAINGIATEQAIGTVFATGVSMGAIQLPPGFNKQKFPGFEEKKKEDREDQRDTTRDENREPSFLETMPLQEALAAQMQFEVENALLNKSKSVGDIMLEILNSETSTTTGKACTTMECLLIAATTAAADYSRQ